MPGADETLAVAGVWVKKAENDLVLAVHALKLGKKCPTDTVCFHAQQCIEKYLKAFLISKGTEFPKTHNIGELLVLMPSSITVSLSPEEQERMTDYATVARYPGIYDDISMAETRKAVVIARRVRKELRAILPKMP
ncbi:MAG: HEPN domain-containing protein [Pseudomonadota bacterium]